MSNLGISLDTFRGQMTADAMRILWKALGNERSLPQPSFASTSISAVDKVKTEAPKSDFSTLFDRSLVNASRAFIELKEGTSTNEIFPQKNLDDLQRDERLDLTVSLLLANTLKTISEKKDNLKLPPRNEKNLDHWMHTSQLWFWANYPYERLPFHQFDSVEASVRGSIENTWRNLQKSYWGEGKKQAPGLRWENTAICALEAIYKNADSLEEAFDEEKFTTICEKLHFLMMRNYLWGQDTFSSDRCSPEGKVKSFNKLSKDMQRNYILITAAALNGIADFMVKQEAK